MQVFTMIDASTYDDRCKCLRWQMQVASMIDASICDDRCENRK